MKDKGLEIATLCRLLFILDITIEDILLDDEKSANEAIEKYLLASEELDNNMNRKNSISVLESWTGMPMFNDITPPVSFKASDGGMIPHGIIDNEKIRHAILCRYKNLTEFTRLHVDLPAFTVRDLTSRNQRARWTVFRLGLILKPLGLRVEDVLLTNIDPEIKKELIQFYNKNVVD